MHLFLYWQGEEEDLLPAREDDGPCREPLT